MYIPCIVYSGNGTVGLRFLVLCMFTRRKFDLYYHGVHFLSPVSYDWLFVGFSAYFVGLIWWRNLLVR